ncbi:MAG: molybdopterin-dependent oxidoreductase [Candidatus Wallbacteria bacterium]|nr:molybdopterin-dependent oxidoreductase [Candidatus Wallbacteria bacterium]
MAAEGELGVVGKRIPLVDALKKTTGEGVYTDDIKLPGMLVGKILRSPHAHARIREIDTASAAALPGVVAVVVGKENRANFGVLPISKDETALAVDKVIFVGDQVAAVAAVDEETALEALDLIRVEYEPYPAFLRPEDSLKPVTDPAHKIHERTLGDTNIHKTVDQDFGDVERAFAAARLVKRNHFEFSSVTHAFTEPHCAIAHYDSGGRLTLWSATQVPHYVHRALAEVTGLPMHRIRVIKPMVGGAFGGKSDPFPHEMAAALLSMKAGRPVKILFDREEVFLSHHGRHPTRTDVAVSVDAAGNITGLDLKALIDGGAWGSFGVVTTYYNGVLSAGPYKLENFRYSGTRVYTNKPPCGAMRGHGAVNSRYAFEVTLDEIAEELGQDPCELRLANFLPPYTKTINEFRITSNGIADGMREVMRRSEWSRKFRRLPYGRGVGVACGFYISGSALPIHWSKLPQSTVHLKLDMDGGITIHSGASDIGQGSDTVLAQCVAEVLGVGLDRVRVYTADSDMDPVDLGSYSSRVTFMAGNAARRAAEQVRAKLIAAASRLTGHPSEGFVLARERVVYATDPSVHVSFTEALAEALANNGALIAKGSYQSPPMGGKFKGAAAGLSPTYSFQAYVSEVEVDPETGFIAVKKVWAAHDCGRALNPTAVEGQIEGSIHMGLGQFMAENFRYNHGNVLNPNFLDYKMLSPAEMPEVECVLIESNDPEGPFGAKESGEGPLLPILPCVANAIYDAVGVRSYRLPVTPEDILLGIQRNRAAGIERWKHPARPREAVR